MPLAIISNACHTRNYFSLSRHAGCLCASMSKVSSYWRLRSMDQHEMLSMNTSDFDSLNIHSDLFVRYLLYLAIFVPQSSRATAFSPFFLAKFVFETRESERKGNGQRCIVSMQPLTTLMTRLMEKFIERFYRCFSQKVYYEVSLEHRSSSWQNKALIFILLCLFIRFLWNEEPKQASLSSCLRSRVKTLV